MTNKLCGLALLALFGRIAYQLCWCFLHPEVWDSQPGNDPRIFVPYAVLLGIGIAILWYWLDARFNTWLRRKQEYERRINRAIEAAREYRGQGRTEEAEAAFHKALRLYFEKQTWLNSRRF